MHLVLLLALLPGLAHAGWVEPTNEGTMEAYVPDGMVITGWSWVKAELPGTSITAEYDKAFGSPSAYFGTLKHELDRDFGIRGGKAAGEFTCTTEVGVERCTGRVKGKRGDDKGEWILVVTDPVDRGAGVALLVTGTPEDLASHSELVQGLTRGFRPRGTQVDPVGGTHTGFVGKSGDQDGDGLADEMDACPLEPFRTQDGCSKQAALQRACDGGDGESCGLLAWDLADAGEAEAARQLHARGCELGFADSCAVEGARLLGEGRYPEARELLQRACDGGDGTSCDHLDELARGPRSVPDQQLDRALPGPCRSVSKNVDGYGDPFGWTTYTYDAEERLIEQLSHEGSRTTLRYDTSGRKVKETTQMPDAEPWVLTWRYDASGRVAEERKQSPWGTSVKSWTWDAEGRPLTIVETHEGQAPSTTTFTWLTPQHVRQVTDGQYGETIEKWHDDRGRVVREARLGDDGEVYEALETTWDETGSAITRHLDGNGEQRYETRRQQDAHGNLLDEQHWLGATLRDRWVRHDYSCWE